jgi:hypothetical protein
MKKATLLSVTVEIVIYYLFNNYFQEMKRWTQIWIHPHHLHQFLYLIKAPVPL